MAPRRRTRDDPPARMSLLQHLGELRRRATRAVGAILLGTVGGWFLYDLVWPLLEAPIRSLADTVDAVINFTNITGAFDMRMQVAITLGIVMSSPVWLYQLFAFLLPGLKRREKKLVLGFVLAAFPLFLSGCAAGWLVFPHIVELMATFVPAGATSYYDAKYYLDFVLKLVLVVGVAFVMPVVLVLLNFVGVLPALSILRGWRWAIVAITIFTAIATPAADLLSMLLLAAPMVVLYFLAVGVAFLHDRAVARRQERALDDDPALVAEAVGS
jgi:sec-independent protein translocase protein TatC